jgi:hypothetical protein
MEANERNFCPKKPFHIRKLASGYKNIKKGHAAAEAKSRYLQARETARINLRYKMHKHQEKRQGKLTMKPTLYGDFFSFFSEAKERQKNRPGTHQL